MSDTTLYIDLTDAEGEATGQTVPVVIEYVTTVDQDYGADADGHRGETRYEREVLDVWINPEHLNTLNSEQVERVLAEANAQFEQRRIR
jgi:hypothetical protein